MRNAESLAATFAILALAVQLTVSGSLLVGIGISYDVDGGMLIEKIHPGTYLAALAMLARLAAWLHRAGLAVRCFWRLRELSLFFLCMIFCLLYASALTGIGGLIALIDTFLPAGMIGLALADATPLQLKHVRTVLQFFLLVNAMLALMEAVTNTPLFPPAPGRVEPATDFRPTALYDHPLTGAAATMLGLLLHGPRAKYRLQSLGYDAIMFTALLAFGGRIALVVFIAAIAGRYAATLLGRGLHYRLRMRDLWPAAAVAGCSTSLAIGALASGMADRLAAHLYWDPSAQVRIDQFRILGRLSLEQIVLGCRRTDVTALIEPIRLQFRVAVIENFWLVMFLTLGALCFPVFVLGVAALMRFLWRVGDAQGRLMLLSLLVVASTSNSLGRKSTLLTLLVGCVATSCHGWRCGSVTANHTHSARLRYA